MTETTQEALPISITGLSKRYGAAVALDQVDLDIRSGEFLTLLGPSGSGKTTLLMAIAGFMRPDSGSLKFGDAEMICVPPHKRDVGMVFQSYALFPHMNVAQNVAFALNLRKVPAAEVRRRVEQALHTVQLDGLGERGIEQLSGGQRQRVALARAIVFEPRILLMDEPLSALDKKLREHMQVELRRLHELLGITTVYVTHDQREALTMSDRIAVIHQGRVAQVGTPQDIYERPASRFIADFIGESSFLPVRFVDGHAWCAERLLKLPAGARPRDPAVLMLRPEHLRLTDAADDPELNTFTGTLDKIIYQGDSHLLLVTLQGGVAVGVRGPRQDGRQGGLPPLGATVTLGLHRDGTVLVPDD
ncbi:MAG TPA: ABC transporter ATP-binding protein [Castellaniella sp.]|nr:ABC transporter ATP-binding protein [Castellaniella sp.]